MGKFRPKMMGPRLISSSLNAVGFLLTLKRFLIISI